jgi:hypothetical protein
VRQQATQIHELTGRCFCRPLSGRQRLTVHMLPLPLPLLLFARRLQAAPTSGRFHLVQRMLPICNPDWYGYPVHKTNEPFLKYETACAIVKRSTRPDFQRCMSELQRGAEMAKIRSHVQLDPEVLKTERGRKWKKAYRMQVRPCVVDASEDQGSANLSLIPADK